MRIKQITIFVENKPGRLYSVIDLLGSHNINIRSLSIADTNDFGVVRIIVSDPESAYKILKDNKYSAGINDVVAVEIPDRPNGLSELLATFAKNNVNIEYMYAFVMEKGKNAVMVFSFDNIDNANKILQKEGVKVLDEKFLKEL